MKIKERTMWRRIDESTDEEFRCDWCGFSSDNENRFTEIGDQTVCRMCLSRSKYDEGWLGDKMKAGWEKVKTGAKKVGKAIGDAFNGPFRKGDQIVMKGEDGESFKGTITDYSMSNKTYEVMLGKQTNEGLQEDVLDMADREDELVWMIQDSFWHLADLGDPDILRELIENCVELEKVKPGKLDEIINQEF